MKFYDDELLQLYSSPDVTGVIKCRMRWVTPVTRKGRREIHTEILLQNITEKERIQLIWKDGIKICLKEMLFDDVDRCGWVLYTR